MFLKSALLKPGLLRLSGFGCERTHDVRVQAGAFISISGRRSPEFGKPSNQRSKTTKIIQNPSPLSKWSLHCPYSSHSTLFDFFCSFISRIQCWSTERCFLLQRHISAHPFFWKHPFGLWSEFILMNLLCNVYHCGSQTHSLCKFHMLNVLRPRCGTSTILYVPFSKGRATTSFWALHEGHCFKKCNSMWQPSGQLSAQRTPMQHNHFRLSEAHLGDTMSKRLL